MPAKSSKVTPFDVEGSLKKLATISTAIDLETLEVEDDRFYKIEYRTNKGQKRTSFARELKVVNSPGGMILSGMVNIPVDRVRGLSIVSRLQQVRETKAGRAGKGIDLLKCEFERALGREVDPREIKKRSNLPMMGD